MIKRILRILLFLIMLIAAALIVLIVFGVAPINRDVDRRLITQQMEEHIDSLRNPSAKPTDFRVGFSKINLTPSYRTATAGYAKRRGRLFESVHDSIYVRTIVVDNGVSKVAVVSADLLIIPPTVTERLEKELPEIGFSLDNTYLGAIHSHNSIGNWGKGATSFIYGDYDEEIVKFITDKIKISIQAATTNMLPSVVRKGAIPLEGTVHNRLIDDGPVDSLLRVVEVHRSDSSKLLLMSFTAHATCLYSRDLQLSRDYPGKLVDAVEASGYEFVMFMAGAVGSHTSTVPEQGWTCVDWMAEGVSNGFLNHRDQLHTIKDSTLIMHRVPLLLSDPQVKVLQNWRIRPWLFNWAFGDYPEYLTVLRLGDLIMVGTPCDYSGQLDPVLDSLAAKHGMSSMVTSFNGGYIGYVTPTKYYDNVHYETQLMNWYGPGNAEYIEHCLEQLMLTVVDK